MATIDELIEHVPYCGICGGCGEFTNKFLPQLEREWRELREQLAAKDAEIAELQAKVERLNQAMREGYCPFEEENAKLQAEADAYERMSEDHAGFMLKASEIIRKHTGKQEPYVRNDDQILEFIEQLQAELAISKSGAEVDGIFFLKTADARKYAELKTEVERLTRKCPDPECGQNYLNAHFCHHAEIPEPFMLEDE